MTPASVVASLKEVDCDSELKLGIFSIIFAKQRKISLNIWI